MEDALKPLGDYNLPKDDEDVQEILMAHLKKCAHRRKRNLKYFFDSADVNHRGYLTFHQFYLAIMGTKLKPTPEKDDIKRLYASFDSLGDGKVNWRLLEGKIRRHGESKRESKRESRTYLNIFEKLTDTSRYTGTHKHRFDDHGRGRGRSGRTQEGEKIADLSEIMNRKQDREANGRLKTIRVLSSAKIRRRKATSIANVSQGLQGL